jgi:transcriptional regulator with XRE-family HTH domain
MGATPKKSRRQVRTPRPRFDAKKVAADMALRGWNAQDLAKAADLSDMTILRFITGAVQTAKTNERIARAFGYAPKRYFLGIHDADEKVVA